MNLKELYYTTLGGIHKKLKASYYLRGYRLMLTPRFLCRWQARRRLAAYDRLSPALQQHIDERVAYYCRPHQPATLPADAPRLRDNRLKKPRLVKQTVYYFDSMEYTRCFDPDLRWQIIGGDVNTEAPVASITKSRPIPAPGAPSNNVLLKLNKTRHFIFFHDPFRWEQKQTRIIFRGVVLTKENRRRFIEMWQHHPLCDLQDTYTGMSLYDHLHYRYIMALEGNDVATNLKWIMSSNSIAVMPRPTCETWFMEGRLIPNYHYIEIADDFHDLIDRITYYEEHPDEAKQIIAHANEWTRQFQNDKVEDIISLKVMQRYLEMSNA